MIRGIRHLSLAARILLLLVAVFSMAVAIEVSVLGKDNVTDATTVAGATDVEEFLPDANDAIPPSAPSLIDYSEITGRPLFNESRRPIVVDVTPSSTPRATSRLSTQWKLTGIVMAGGNTFVLVEGKRDHQTLRLKKGAILDGWYLDKISANRIDLVSGTKSASLILHEEDRKNQ